MSLPLRFRTMVQPDASGASLGSRVFVVLRVGSFLLTMGGAAWGRASVKGFSLTFVIGSLFLSVGPASRMGSLSTFSLVSGIVL